MTAVKFITFWCDESACDAYLNTPERLLRDARSWAWQFHQWAHRDGFDYCPEHAQQIATETHLDSPR